MHNEQQYKENSVDNGFHRLLICASAAHKKYCRQRFQELDLTEGQPKVLAVLSAMENCLQKELAEACRVEPATMTSLITKMEEKGLIVREREMVSGGKRAYRIFLTEDGRRVASEVKEIILAAEQQCFDGFTREEIEVFLKQFSRVAENLENV